MNPSRALARPTTVTPMPYLPASRSRWESSARVTQRPTVPKPTSQIRSGFTTCPAGIAWPQPDGSTLHGQGGDPADLFVQLGPALAAVLAVEQRAVAQTGEELASSGRKRVDVGVERARDRLPGAGALPAVDRRVGRAAPVCLERAGGRRDEPAVRIGRVDGQRPGVAAVSPGVRPVPAAAAVAAPGGAVAAGLVGTPPCARMPRQAMDVAGRLGPMIAERGAAVFGAHQPAQLDADQNQLGIVRAWCDPAHVRGPGPGRKAPVRPRRDSLEAPPAP